MMDGRSAAASRHATPWPTQSASHNGGSTAAALGPLVREHRTRRTYLLAMGTLALVLGAVGLAGAVRLVATLVESPSGEAALVGLLATAPFLLGGTITAVWTLRRARRAVALHKGGIHHRDGRRERAVPWPSIDAVYQKIVRVYRAGVEVDVRDEYRVVLVDGTTLEIDYHLDGVDDLGAALTSAVTAMQVPSYRQAFQAGQPLDFGPVQLDGVGVHTGGKSLPWNEVESISWKAGILASDKAFLMVKRTGGLLAWAKVPVEQIKNYQALMAIAHDMGKAE